MVEIFSSTSWVNRGLEKMRSGVCAVTSQHSPRGCNYPVECYSKSLCHSLLRSSRFGLSFSPECSPRRMGVENGLVVGWPEQYTLHPARLLSYVPVSWALLGTSK